MTENKKNLFWGIFGVRFFLASVVFLINSVIVKNYIMFIGGFLMIIITIWVSIISFSDYYKEKRRLKNEK